MKLYTRPTSVLLTTFFALLVALQPLRALAAEKPDVPRLAAPREVTAGEDAVFTVHAPATTTGDVTFELKTYDGESVWTCSGAFAAGKVSATLTAAEAVALDKGDRVLVATLPGEDATRLYAPVRLRGRVFRNPKEPPANIRPGDEIVLTDLARLEPAKNIAETSVKGKWWRRKFRVPGESEERALVCVEAHDPDDSGACLAGELTLPLNLEGWYEVWVRTYRPQSGGGVDVRLSDEPYFLHANPLEIDGLPGYTRPPEGALVDVRYRAADLSDRHLVFRQPYGTFESESKRCSAALAGVRLVKLSEDEVARIREHAVRKRSRTIGYDNDGFSYFFRWGTRDPACIARLLEPMRDQSAAFLNMELGGLGGIIIPTPYTEMYQMRGHDRDGDLRANAFFRWCFENDVNILKVLTDRAHEVNLKLFASLMMERSFSPDKTMRAHPEWSIRKGRGRWNYALDEVQDYQVKKIAWICENHDIDGFIVDFTRYGHFFNEDEPNKFDHMNAFLRKLRAAIDAVNAKKDRKVALCASFGEKSWHVTHWGTGKLTDQGLDVQTWLKENLFEAIMPEGPTAVDYVQMAKDVGSRTQVWPRKVCRVTFTDHRFVKGDEGPKELENGAKAWYDQGVPGIFFFNHETWTTLGRIGLADELKLRTKVDDVYGYREGPVIEFDRWYPGAAEEEKQRATFAPLCIDAASPKTIESELIVPVVNTFKHPVKVTATWQFPEVEEGKWSVKRTEGTTELGPGEEGHIAFRVSGKDTDPTAPPRLRFAFSTDAGAVFHHSEPVRAVPATVCKRIGAAPTVDGRLNDAAWEAAGGLRPMPFFQVGKDVSVPGSMKATIVRDDDCLYVALDYTGDLAKAKPKRLKRDDRNVYRRDHVQLAIDTAGKEREYRAFTTTLAGEQADSSAGFDSFAGHYRRNEKWNADWEAKTALRDDGFSVEMAIPLSALAVPKPGDVWRMNLILRARDADSGQFEASWSSPARALHLPRAEGTLFGTLRCE